MEDYYIQYFKVLNLVISGIPSILKEIKIKYTGNQRFAVLNLVISGIPSIRNQRFANEMNILDVLNLVISGIPSILEL